MRTKYPAIIFILFFIGCTRQPVDVVEEPRRLSTESLFAVNDNRSVTLGWTPLINGTASELVVYRSAAPDFAPSNDSYLASLPASDTMFVDTSIVNGLFYYYRIVPVEVLPGGVRRNGQPSNIAVGRPFDYSGVTTIQYSNHIQTIFTSSCAVHACHVGPDAGPDKRPPFAKILHGGQFSLKSWAELFEGSDGGAVVVPFKATKSDLIFHTNNDTLIAPVALPHMPLSGFSLPVTQLRTLIRWIDQGAPNDQGAVAYTTNPLGKLLAVNALEDLVAVVDVERNLVIRYVNVGTAADSTLPFGSPHHVRADAQGRFFYVTLINSRELWKFAARTYEFLGRVTIPSQPGRAAQPADIALSVTGDTAYVTDFNSNPGRVVTVDTRSMQVIATVSLIAPFPPTLPHGILLSRDRSRLFITNSGTGNLSMIRLPDMTQTLITLDTSGSTLTTNTNPYLCDMTPDGRYLFVTDFRVGAQDLFVIDFQRDSTKAWRAIPIGGRSVHVAVTPDGRYAYVCNFSNNSIDVIDVSDFSVVSIPNAGRQPHGVVFTPDGSTAYVTTENLTNPNPPHHPTAGGRGVSHVLVIDVASRTIVRQIEVGAWSQGLSFSP